MSSEKYDRCEYCRGSVRERRVTIGLRRANRFFDFRNVPIGVCVRCGERYYRGPVLESLERIMKSVRRPFKLVKLTSLDFSTVSKPDEKSALRN